ncbi:hypothetical protein LWM68_03365 [Niabella sp. W65]|nr:hypothetical protein [Niabella sp. W65]MCH7361902.1 hypothetical protein [Niabella sp. W65]
MILCGYLGESVGWSYGFGLAGIFMLVGLLQFYFTQGIFGSIGLKPKKQAALETVAESPEAIVAEAGNDIDRVKKNPFSRFEVLITIFISVVSLVWVVNDPVSKITSSNVFNFSVGSMDGSNLLY